MSVYKLCIHKKQIVQETKIVRIVFYVLFILFGAEIAVFFINILDFDEYTLKILLAFFIMFIVLLVTFISLDNFFKSTIKTIEIRPENITFIFVNNTKLTVDKSKIHSLIEEQYKFNDYQIYKFFILLKRFAISTLLCDFKKCKSLRNNNNLSFTSVDLIDSKLDINIVKNFLEKYYGEIFLDKIN